MATANVGAVASSSSETTRGSRCRCTAASCPRELAQPRPQRWRDRLGAPPHRAAVRRRDERLQEPRRRSPSPRQLPSSHRGRARPRRPTLDRRLTDSRTPTLRRRSLAGHVRRQKPRRGDHRRHQRQRHQPNQDASHVRHASINTAGQHTAACARRLRRATAETTPSDTVGRESACQRHQAIDPSADRYAAGRVISLLAIG